MPLFNKKFESKPIPLRQNRCNIGIPAVAEDLDDFRQISLNLGNKELRFADGIWMHSSRKGDVDDMLRLKKKFRVQLDVKNSSLAAPEFMDSYPSNKTASLGSRVVFQCRVHSEEHPTIKWFKRHSFVGSLPAGEGPSASPASNFSAHIVRYDGRTYELLSTASEMMIGPQIYLSKLILDGVRLRDAGHYACAAISYRGHKIREAFLDVLPAEEQDEEYWNDYDNSDEGVPGSDPREFLLLFLMPLGLALLPLTVWCSYLVYKRFSGHGDCQRMDSDEELDTERCVLGGN